MKKDRCKTCKMWRNSQRDLSYQSTIGFCVNPYFKFNTSQGRLIGVYDTQNEVDIRKVTGNPSHDIETASISGLNPSRYRLVTEEDFGCVQHVPK